MTASPHGICRSWIPPALPCPALFSPLPLLLHSHGSWGLYPTQISSLNFKSRSQIPQTQHDQHWPFVSPLWPAPSLFSLTVVPGITLCALLTHPWYVPFWPHPLHQGCLPDTSETCLQPVPVLLLQCCHSGLKTLAPMMLCALGGLSSHWLSTKASGQSGRGTSDTHICFIASVCLLFGTSWQYLLVLTLELPALSGSTSALLTKWHCLVKPLLPHTLSPSWPSICLFSLLFYDLAEMSPHCYMSHPTPLPCVHSGFHYFSLAIASRGGGGWLPAAWWCLVSTVQQWAPLAGPWWKFVEWMELDKGLLDLGVRWKNPNSSFTHSNPMARTPKTSWYFWIDFLVRFHSTGFEITWV